MNQRKTHILHIWIAVLAILFSALAPTISHALAATSNSVGAAEICTADGFKLVPSLGEDGSKAPVSLKHTMEHCAFCSTHNSGDALAGVPPRMFAVNVGRTSYPSLYYAAPHTLHAWSTANPRAPPFLA